MAAMFAAHPDAGWTLAIARQVLNHIHPCTASVVASPRIPLGVLICPYGTQSFKYGLGYEVLTWDHFESFLFSE